MTKPSSNEHHFQVDLRGVIDLLSDHLYSGPQVYVRELMQNAVDAIVARQQHESGHEGKIRLEVVPSESGAPTLVINDNGIGLTEAEVHQFLATIGQSSKRDPLTQDDFIGQFGVGLLSGFVVSEEIVVITRSLQADAPTIQWKGRADGTYSIGTLDFDAEPGTQVFLRSKPGCHDFFDSQFVVETARYFGRHLPIEVEIAVGDDVTCINETPPWRFTQEEGATLTEQALDYGRQTLEMDFLDAIPIKSESGGVNGFAYILPHSSTVAIKSRHRVYIKDMLLSEHAEGILPDWAFFARCVLNATGLRPLASREGLYEDEALLETRADLGASLRKYLVDLSASDPQRLEQLIAIHHLPMKALAVEDEDFFRMVIDWLPFETSLGTLSMGDYHKKFGTVRYVRSRDRFRQVAGVAAAQKMCVVNTCYTFDTQLVERIPLIMRGRQIEYVEANELTERLAELNLDEQDEAFGFLQVANAALQPMGCEATIRKFMPANLPAMYTTNESADFMRSVDQSKDVGSEMWSGILDSIAGDSGSHAAAQLCFNFKNSVIERLTRIDDPTLQKRAVETLYIQALLLGHYPLKDLEMNLLGDGLLGWIELCLAAREEREGHQDDASEE